MLQGLVKLQLLVNFQGAGTSPCAVMDGCLWGHRLSSVLDEAFGINQELLC